MLIEELDRKDCHGGGAFAAAIDRLFASISKLPFPFLLESGGLSRSDAGRFSFMGADPFMTFEARGEKLRIGSGGSAGKSEGNPLSVLRGLLSEFREDTHPVFPFCGGAVGYIGYEGGEHIESLPPRKPDSILVPDLYFCFYDTALTFDHLKGRVFIASSGIPEKGAGKRVRAKERLRFFRELLSQDAGSGREAIEVGSLSANFRKDEYIEAVDKIKAYIETGDIYQANLSQRFEADFSGPPYQLYRKFREINPVPFGAFLDYPELSIVSNSPERFLSLRRGILETRPIKGTIERALAPMNDERMKSDLKGSFKDGAEHLMIVDLERNDLGKVCRYGSVKVEELKRIETYSNLHHMVSIVSGEVKEGVDAVECVIAAFPGGSITGAPKIRAMEIIHEVEPNPRWVYTGSIGYIGFDGGMDMNIAIRTAFVTGGKVCFSVGGGIVADSDPEAEYEETLLKGEVFREIAAGRG